MRSTPRLAIWVLLLALWGTPARASTLGFRYTGTEQTFIVPAGVWSLFVSADGGSGAVSPAGGAQGGTGANATAWIPVYPGERLYVVVGGRGSGQAGGFNGGGGAPPAAGAGGGASDVRTVSCGQACPGSEQSLASRLLVAGGGGGGGAQSSANGPGGSGGNAGISTRRGTMGSDQLGPGIGDTNETGGGPGLGGGYAGSGAGGSGGSPGADGGLPGILGASGDAGLGGAGGPSQMPAGGSGDGGGGGGGWFGGGGGGAGACGDANCTPTALMPAVASAGGGGGGSGSSYAPAGRVTPGMVSSDGAVALTWLLPRVALGRASVAATHAELTGTVLPTAPITGCRFAYGPAPDQLAWSAPCSSTPSAVGHPAPVAAAVTRLTPHTTYYWELIATQADGWSTTGPGRFRTPLQCVVPALIGDTLSEARSALHQAHCGLGKVSGPRHPPPFTPEVVRRQSPAPGQKLPAGTKVHLTLGV